MTKPFLLKPGENSRIDLQRDINGALVLTIRTPQADTMCRLPPENAIGLALALLEGCGVPVNEAFNRQAAAVANGGNFQTKALGNA